MIKTVFDANCPAKRAPALRVALILGLFLSMLAGCAGVPEPEECWRRHLQDGNEAYRLGKFDRAESEYLDARRCAKEIGSPGPRLVAILSELGNFYMTLGRYEEAESSFREAVAVQEQVFGPDHLQVASTLEQLARLYSKSGRYEKAVETLERALAIRDGENPAVTPAVAGTLEDLAGNLSHLGSQEQAIPLLTRALTIRDAALGPDDPSVARTLGQLAEAHHHLEEDDTAILSISRSLKILGNEFAPVDSLVAGQIRRSGELLEEILRKLPVKPAPPKQSKPDPRPDVATRKVKAGSSPEKQEESVLTLLAGLQKLETGQLDQAAGYFEIARANPPQDEEFRTKLTNGYILLGMEYYSAGQLESAIKFWEYALEVDPKNEKALAYIARTQESMEKAKEISTQK